MVKPISPYLQRPLRTLEEALRELDPGTPDAASEQPAEPPAPEPAAAKPANPKDSITIAGKDVPVPAGEAPPPPTGGQLDIKA